MYGQMTASGFTRQPHRSTTELRRSRSPDHWGVRKGRWVQPPAWARRAVGRDAGRRLLAGTPNTEPHRFPSAYPLRGQSKPPRWMTPWQHEKIHRRKGGPSLSRCGNAAEIVPELVKRGVCPIWSPTRPAPTTRCMAICRKAGAGEEYQQKAESRPGQGTILARNVDGRMQAMLAFHEMGSQPSTTVTAIRAERAGGRQQRLRLPGFVPVEDPARAFCRGIGPFRWVALSGDPQDIYKTDAKVKEIIKDDQRIAPLAGYGARAHQLRTAGAYRRSFGSGGKSSVWRLTNGAQRRSPRRALTSHWPGITSTSGSVASPNRGNQRCAMVLMRFGRCSTPCLTPPASDPVLQGN